MRPAYDPAAPPPPAFPPPQSGVRAIEPQAAHASHAHDGGPPHAGYVKSKSSKVRARLRHAAFTRAPVWLSGGRLARVRPSCTITPVHRNIVLPDLSDGLDGLKIAHLSDLHIGHLTTPDHLPHIIEATARVGGDLIAVTGDFVDLSNGVLDAVIGALGKLEAPLGVYMVPGNHDYLDDGPELIRRFRAAGLKLLVNETLHVAHRGCGLTIAGVDYADAREELARLVQRTLGGHRGGGRQGCDLKLLLAHHPDAFDAACRHGVHLTLSGHTHGGQVVLSDKRGKKGSIGLGSLTFRYPRGLYRRGDSHLYVNSGVGSWFPLRVRCPAEIACLTLRSQASALGEPSHP